MILVSGVESTLVHKECPPLTKCNITSRFLV